MFTILFLVFSFTSRQDSIPFLGPAPINFHNELIIHLHTNCECSSEVLVVESGFEVFVLAASLPLIVMRLLSLRLFCTSLWELFPGDIAKRSGMLGSCSVEDETNRSIALKIVHRVMKNQSVQIVWPFYTR